MMRKTTIALFALAAVGLTQPTAAFARGGGHGGGGGGHGGGKGGGGFHGGGFGRGGGALALRRGFPRRGVLPRGRVCAAGAPCGRRCSLSRGASARELL